MALAVAFALALAVDVGGARAGVTAQGLARADLGATLASVTLPGQDDRFVGLWLPFGFLGLIAWSVWFIRRGLTALYRPIANDHWEPASVVAPAFREDPDVLERAVRSWLANGVSEVLLVLPEDEPDNVARARAAFADDAQVRILITDDPAKRNSLTIGIQTATQPIVVLSDSDTLWEPDLLRNLLMPFADPQVGGVGTRQRVVDPQSSVWRRAADWMLDAKYLTYIPAMARAGGGVVPVRADGRVPPRAAPPRAARPQGRDLLGPALRFGGRRQAYVADPEPGPKDRLPAERVAWTMMPDTTRGFFMQRVRWSRNSYRCYLRAIFRGWLFRQPLITRVSVLQGLLAPLSLTVGFCFVGLAIARHDWLATAVWAAWITCGRGLRAFDHLRQNPRNIVLLPFMTVLILFVLTAIKYFTFLTMNKQAWVTRRQDRGVAEGQSAASVTAIAPGRLQAATSGD